MEIVFWVALFVVGYSFVGYGIVLYFLVKVKKIFVKPFKFIKEAELPTVTLLIAAYNEEDMVLRKIANTLALDYDHSKLQLIFVTDGSSDKTPDLVKEFDQIVLLHRPERAGKMAAIKRAIPHVTGQIMIFTDANTFLNESAIKELVKHYQNKKVGAVAGEKRIFIDEYADASSAGEGFYWKYESKLKKLSYELYSNVGAAGELFSIRTSLYEPVESDTIIDDHMIAMRIAEKGYIIAYEQNAYATETASANTKEELKRKIRIAAGGMQSIFRLTKAANPFNNFTLWFQYVSHRVLRWSIVPFLLILVFLLNAYLAYYFSSNIYRVLFITQLVFYTLSIVGYLFESRNWKLKIFFIPYYFCLMNYAVIAGIFRYFANKQSAAWEKSKRKD